MTTAQMENTVAKGAPIEHIDMGDGSVSLKYTSPRNSALIAIAFIVSGLSGGIGALATIGLGDRNNSGASAVMLLICVILLAGCLYYMFTNSHNHVHVVSQQGFKLFQGDLPFSEVEQVVVSQAIADRFPVQLSAVTKGKEIRFATCRNRHVATALINELRSLGLRS